MPTPTALQKTSSSLHFTEEAFTQENYSDSIGSIIKALPKASKKILLQYTALSEDQKTSSIQDEIFSADNGAEAILPVGLWQNYVVEHLLFYTNGLSSFNLTCKLFNKIVGNQNSEKLNLARQLYKEGISWGTKDNPRNLVEETLATIAANNFSKAIKLIQAINILGCRNTLKVVLKENTINLLDNTIIALRAKNCEQAETLISCLILLGEKQELDDAITQGDINLNVQDYLYCRTPLHYAAIKGDIDVIRLLIEKGGDVHRKAHIDNTPLHEAARHGQADAMELLIKNGSHVDATNHFGETPLHVAAQHGHIKVIELLLTSTAYINFTNEFSNTPLHEAAKHGQTYAMELLLTNGASINAKDYYDGDTPLHYAIKNEYTNAVKLLLKKGADVNQQNNKGNTPLHCAAKKNNTAIVHLLIKKTVRLCVKNAKGDTPLDIAKVNCNTVVTTLIQNEINLKWTIERNILKGGLLI